MFTLDFIKKSACEVAGIDVKDWENNTAELAELRSVVVRWLYAYGMSEREIARMLGWSQQRVNERKNCTKTSQRIKALESAFASAMEKMRQA
jgi:transposase